MSEETHPLRDRLPLPLMAAIAALPPLSIDMYLPAMPRMAASLGTEISTIQNSLSMFLVSFGLGMLLFGPLSDRFGRRPLAILGLAGYGLASLGLTLSPNAESFLLFRFFQGLLGSAATIVVPAMIRDCFGKDTAKGMSTVTMIMLMAPLVSPLIGSILLTFSSWRAIFLVLFLYTMVVLVLVVLKLPETLAAENKMIQKSFLRNYHAILSNPRIYPFLGIFLMSSLAFFTYLTSAPFIYITWFGVSEMWFGVIFATTAASLILANFINVRHVSHVGSRRMIQLGLATGVMFACLLLAAILADLDLVWVVICCFVLIGSLGIISVNAESLILIEFPNQASSAWAVSRTLRFCTGALVGPILALVYTGTPLPITLLVLSVLVTAILIQLITFSAGKKKPGQGPG